MKKKQKSFLGFLGLFAVAITTMVAANIPSPGAIATSSITDTIEVRVVGSTPAVTLSSTVNGKDVSFPTINVNLRYENADRVILRQTYVDDGAEKEILAYNNLGEATGEIKNISVTVDKYGEYKISAEAVGKDGVPSPEDYITFKYLPILASYDIDPITGKYMVHVDSVGVDVYTADFYLDDELIATQNRMQLENSEKVPLDLTKEGTYKITIAAKNIKGETIYVPLSITIKYTPAEVPDAGVPDTGGLFQNLNISSEDYLTTGLIMFFVLGVVAIGIIISGHRNDHKKRH